MSTNTSHTDYPSPMSVVGLYCNFASNAKITKDMFSGANG